MAIYRGPGGPGDATTDATSEGIVASNAATAAATSAANAATSATNASTSASSASSSASSATSSASSASSSASTATTQATNASNSATAAQTAETNAETAETNATASAVLANDWATKTSGAVAGGEFSAKYHASLASTSASNASTSASNASSSASTASTQASNASTSATNAANSATAAAASYDSFDDRYLGAKASAPSVDNDGNALLTGAIYWNTASNALFIWDGSAWNAAAFTASGSVTAFNTRTGAVTLSSSDVTTALGFTPGQGTVTSVSGTSPVSVATGTTTPVISMPAATTSVNGYLTSTDWTTFNNKGSGTVTSVTATSPVTSTGGATPVIAMPAATTSVNGYLTSTDWNTFNGKSNTNGTVTSVAALTLGTTGTDLSSTVTNGTTTPVITLNVPTASASNRGVLSSADWTTFNNKGTVTSASVVSANGFAGTVATATTTPAITLSTSITGVVKGNGTAISAATAGTDYVEPATATSFTATQTFTGSTTSLGAVFQDAAEVTTVSATAATGTINYDVTTQSVLYYTTSASANWTVNVRGNGTTSLNTLMSTGQALTVVFLVTQGSTAYYNNAFQIDGSSVTPKYQGGTAPTSGNASGIDAYSYTIIKTGSAAFTVLAAQTQFK
jgi:hypothetical protein